MIKNYSQSNIGLNFSKNCSNMKTQAKARTYEIPACKTLLLTEYHNGIENSFVMNKEIITFSSKEEMLSKIKFLLKNKNIIDKIFFAGYNRVLKEHDSCIRLNNVLECLK
jgi:spore maturation protein CgeB